MRGAVLAALLIAAPGPGVADQPPPEPDDYRTEQFRAPVPATLSGATTIDNAAAYALWRTGRVAFIDVFPKPVRPANLPEDTLWIDPKRDSIPGAFWVPNVGFGRLPPQRDSYFQAALTEVTGGDRDGPIVFFCLSDCWMSWNAARRAMLEYGHTRVFWYPDGSDGWEDIGAPLAELEAWSPE